MRARGHPEVEHWRSSPAMRHAYGGALQGMERQQRISQGTGVHEPED